jgi:hypothetical protein
VLLRRHVRAVGHARDSLPAGVSELTIMVPPIWLDEFGQAHVRRATLQDTDGRRRSTAPRTINWFLYLLEG